MVYNFRQAQKEFYVPGKRPALVNVPAMNYIAVRGHGDPNDEGSEYQQLIPLLYAVAYTIKMSKRGSYQIAGYFDFVVPPLEGLWWQEGVKGVDYAHKDKFSFISMIRLPDFVTPDVFNWAVNTAAEKKQLDMGKVEFFPMHEGLCVQALHVGSYDDEPATVAKMHDFINQHDLQLAFSDHRRHHEIYLSDPRRVKPENRKTGIRIPVRKNAEVGIN